MTRKVRDEKGFILAAALVAMVVVGAAAAAGYFIGHQEFRIGKGFRESATAFYAANAGIQRELATWSIPKRWTMDGGQTIAVGPVPLPGGASYSGIVQRIDNTPEQDTDTERYYLIRITGRARSPLQGEEVQNTQALVLRVRYYDFCCTAAITAKDHFEQAGSSLIDGNNTTPTAWSGQCDSASTANLAGIEVECDTCFKVSGGASTRAGNPPVETDTTLRSKDLLNWDEVTWDFLRSKAEKIYPPGATVTNTAPVVGTDPLTGMPVCNTSVQSNWGEPTQPTHVCFNYFPIIWAQGDLYIQSSAYGQGLLVVDGDLSLKGGYQFYGIILVRGQVLTEGTAGKIWGSLIVAGQDVGGIVADSRLAGSATVRYSSCAAMRAKRYASLAKKEPLPLRSWVEALR
jgi:hypothetical protein